MLLVPYLLLNFCLFRRVNTISLTAFYHTDDVMSPLRSHNICQIKGTQYEQNLHHR